MTEYTITELSETTGVARRNIHFYVQQGLLPPPAGAGLAARYGDEHLLRLRAIPLLRNRGLRLDEIRERLTGLDAPGLRALLAPFGDAGTAPPPAPHKAPRPGRPWPRGETVTRYLLAPGVELQLTPEAEQALLARLPELSRLVAEALSARPQPNSNGGH
jgi:DNA-binding transcriptional MerR regulator